jgi:hypothetical protein
MENQIIIDDNELVEFILTEAAKQGSNLSKEDIQNVLDLEFEFLKLKGVIEE